MTTPSPLLVHLDSGPPRELVAVGARAKAFLEQAVSMLRLQEGRDRALPRIQVQRLRIHVRSSLQDAQPLRDQGCDLVMVIPDESRTPLLSFVLQLTSRLVQEAQARGSLLLHGGLVTRRGRGCILAGPTGSGKSTACGRLPAGWEAVSDDLCLVVPDSGAWRAHPWPTWSRFGAGDESWAVGRPVPLRGLFFLEQVLGRGAATPLGQARTLGKIMEAAEQASGTYCPPATEAEVLRSRRLTCFHNALPLASAVPAFTLALSLDNPFWQDIDRALGWPGA